MPTYGLSVDGYAQLNFNLSAIADWPATALSSGSLTSSKNDDLPAASPGWATAGKVYWVGLAVDRNVDRDRCGLNRRRRRGIVAKQVNAHAMRDSVVRELGVIFFGVEPNDMPAVRAVSMAVIDG